MASVEERVKQIIVEQLGTDEAEVTPNASFVDMPDFSEEIKKQAVAAGQYFVGDKVISDEVLNISSSIYVDGNVTINGSAFQGVGCIFATGSITFNGSSQNVSAADSICIYSKTGNITLNGSGAVLDGIVYAPNGCVTLNGSSQTVNGRVIADTVEFNGSNIRVISGSEELRSIPATVVRLVQ
jgi:formylmethanofuran dehydrogenase subunit C